MKRERVNTAETELMQGGLDVNVYNMEKNLQAAIEKVNQLFGTSISVRFNEDLLPEEAPTEEEIDSNGEEAINDESTEEPTTEETTSEEKEETIEVKEKGEGGE